MELQGEQQISATQQEVWDALNDADVLRRCIPGCQTLEVTEDGGFEAVVSVKVGPVKAKFKGSVTLSDMRPPHGYKITGEGKGGVAGFASGGAVVSLETKDGGTLLTYNVEAKVGGKLAQIGSRLIAGTAKKLAEEFFVTFGKILSGEIPLEEDQEAEVEDKEKVGILKRVFKGKKNTD